MFSTEQSRLDFEVPQPRENREWTQALTREARALAGNNNLEVSAFVSPVLADKVAQQVVDIINFVNELPGLDKEAQPWIEDTLAQLGVYAGLPRLRYSDKVSGTTYPQDKLILPHRVGKGQRDLPNQLISALRNEHNDSLHKVAESDAFQKKLLLNYFNEYMGPQRLRGSLLQVWPPESRAQLSQAINELDASLYACVAPGEEHTEKSWSEAYSNLSPTERDRYVQQLQIEIRRFMDRLEELKQ